jgi:tetratricopeptide (TPR) repeat protein
MAAATVSPAESRIEIQVRRIRGLLDQSRFAEAQAAAATVLAEVPDNRDLLYLTAVSQRYLQRTADALQTLHRLEAAHPEYGRLFQERGHCHRALGDFDTALAAYRRAVTLDAALPASWNSLQMLYRASGRLAEAEAAGRYLAQLKGLPPDIVNASSMLNEGDLVGAERVVRRFLQTQGNHAEGMRLLAQIGIQLDVLDDAEFLLESVLEFAPDHHAARYEYAGVLTRRHRHAAALEQAHKLRGIDPENRSYRTLYAAACVGLGDHAAALEMFRELLTDAPQDAELHLSVAHALKTLGRQQEAVESYRAAAAAAPGFGDAYWSLANLKTYRFMEEEIGSMRAAEAAPAVKPADRYHLCFALGKALEDRGEYRESFRYYERGNALKKAESRYQPEPIERNARLQKTVFSRAFIESRRGAGSQDPAPIFIVGLPRAGSTLIEQILASHSEVEGTMELADVPRLVQRLQGREPNPAAPRYPGVLEELAPDQLRQFGAKYLSDTQVYRSGKPRFIDKMPNNFRHLGLIHLILPNATLIDARREPMACCFGNFKQLFASGQEFSYDLDDIARYYLSYVELMDHWDEVLPGKILRVQHESLVEDLPAQVRRILDFCSLKFEAQCLEFHKTERSVRTASSEQVRLPLYKEGLDQWRHFEPWLEPLKKALAPSTIHPPPNN